MKEIKKKKKAAANQTARRHTELVKKTEPSEKGSFEDWLSKRNGEAKEEKGSFEAWLEKNRRSDSFSGGRTASGNSGGKFVASADGDIAPVKDKNLFEKIGAWSYGGLTPNGDGTYSYDDEKRKEALGDDGRTWFQKSGLWDDGYQFGDVSKTILAGGTDLAENIGTGIIGVGEKAVDAVAWLGAASYGGLIPQTSGEGIFARTTYGYSQEQKEKDRAEAVEFISKDLYDERDIAKKLITNPVESVSGIDVETASVFGDKTDSLAQSAGQLGVTAALSAAGIPFWVTTGITSFGGEVENALNNGATFEEAGVSGVISAAAEVLTEKIGGISFGGKTLTDGLVKRLTTGIASKAARTLIKLGVDGLGEGFEEILSGVLSALGQKMTYQEDKELNELFSSDEAWESFIGGFVLGGGSNVTGIAKQAVTGEDIVTGLSKNEQKVVDQLYNEAVAEAEKSGEKLTLKEKEQLHDSIVEKMEKGEISTDMLEEMFGGETYKTFRDTVDKENAALKEISELYTGEELQQQIDSFMENSESVKLKTKLSEEVSTLLKGDRLIESYNERARRGQKFEADLSQYDSKYHATIQNAINSGVMNNTRRSHELVDLIAKISADKGITFDFANNAKIKESGFAVEGKTVNGYVTESGITLNVESPQYLNTTVGHEITHVLEGTELYNDFRDLVFEYAKGRKVKNGRFANEYMERLYDARQRYKDIDGYQGVDGFEKIKNEVAADLVGEYLFHDTDFIRNLSVNHRNVFQKMWDEIKYLCKVATAGSKEARELEKVKKAFEEAYRAEGKATGTNAEDFYDSSTKYSLRVTDKDTLDFLDSQETVTTYKTMQLVDGKLYPPMASRIDGKFEDYSELGAWEQATEHPELIKDGNKFKLDKGKGQGSIEAAYNPYMHSSNLVLNDQFSGAYKRNNLVTVECEVPASELTSGYHAEFAKDSVGWHPWHTGTVAGQLRNAKGTERQVLLSRWIKPVRIVPDSEVAAMYKELLDGTDVEVPDNVVTPSLLNELRNAGVKIKESGRVKYSLSDSDGKSLTKEQQDYFKDSKMRDENGNLKVMYHGTPNGDFTVFKDGTYFTDNKAYADRYQSPSASSISSGKVASNPKTFEVYLDIKKPFDITDAEARRIYIEEYIKGGNALGINPYLSDAEYDEISTIDWTEGEDLRDFLIENGYDYDGLVLDEGADGGYGDDVQSRGTSYVVFSPEQVKNIDNAKPTSDPDIRYSISPNLAKDLEAIRNNTFETKNNEVYVGESSNFLVSTINAKPLSVTMSPRKAYAAMVTEAEAKAQDRWEEDLDYHGLGEQGLYDALEASENPVAAFVSLPDDKGSKRENRIVLVTDYVNNGSPVAVVEEVDSIGRVDGRTRKVNKTVTAFDRRLLFEDIKKAAADGRLLAYDKKRSQALATSLRTTSSVDLRGVDFDENIRHFWGNVKWAKQKKAVYTAKPTTNGKTAVALAMEKAGISPESFEDSGAQHSLSSEDYAPTRYGTYNVSGKEVMLEDVEDTAPFEDIGPVVDAENATTTDYAVTTEEQDETPIRTTKERIEARILNSETEATNVRRRREEAYNRYTEQIDTLQAQYDAKPNKNTKAAEKILRRIERLQRIRDDVDADYAARIGSIERRIEKLTEQAEQDHTEEDRLERVNRKVDRDLEADKAELAKEFEQRRAALEEETRYRTVYVSKKAQSLYDELNGLRKGVRASRQLGYLLDVAETWAEENEVDKAAKFRSLRSALVNVVNSPDTVVNGESYLESAVRQALDEDYADRLSTLAQLDEDYANKVSKLEAEADEKRKAARTAERRRAKQTEYRDLFERLAGDTSTWVDKKLGLQYKVNTLRRNLRDVVRDANGNPDYERADAIYDELQGSYNHHEAELNRRSNQIKGEFAEMKINKYEDAYIQMLGELRHNPDTELTEDVVSDYLEAHRDKIDEAKVDKAIERAREVYDTLFAEMNEVLDAQGMKPVPYRKGYFPHLKLDKQPLLARIFNWKVKNNEIPTDIAGLTEQFNPNRSWQSFNKQRKGDKTDYSFLTGLDMYVQGSLDWIYHIEDIQKRRAFENHLRYVHSDEGVQERIDAIVNSHQYTAEEAQEQIDLVYREAGNPLNNFVTDLRTGTNTLAGKKNSMDRGMEDMTSRKFYSTMTNLSNRVTANMVAGSVSSALTNFIPITQSWGEVSPLRSLEAMGETIRSVFRDDGVVDKSDFLTNRLRKADKLSKTTWDKVSEKAVVLMEAVDGFTSQVVWRSKYIDNTNKGMSEAEAIKNADLFAESVLAGRSRGNAPTIFDAKNPLIKMLTAFQLEVNNQYGYMFKDMPQDMRNEAKGKLVGGYVAMFVGAYAYNALFSALTGRDAAFDPIGIVVDLLKDIGLLGDDDDEPEDGVTIATNLLDNVLEELPFVSGLVGGGRVPLSSALPYGEGVYETVTNTMQDVADKDWSSLTSAWLNPLFYVVAPFGGGQIRKTAQGLSMFSDDHPIAGSYTNSGKLRFPVDDTIGSRIKAGIFGQYSSKNARDYFDGGEAPLGEKQIQEFMDLDIPIQDYWEYRGDLAGLDTIAEKADYIAELDLPVEKKNILINNRANRKDPIDMTGYEDFSGLEEFDFATKNPGKYLVSRIVSSSFDEYSEIMETINGFDSKNVNGKTVSGLKKQRTYDYIFGLDIDYGAKCILYKSAGYAVDDAMKSSIVSYLSSRRDISADDRKAILKELGFAVREDGSVVW